MIEYTNFVKYGSQLLVKATVEVWLQLVVTCLDSGICCHDFKEQCPAEFARGIFVHSYYCNVIIWIFSEKGLFFCTTLPDAAS